MGTSVSTRLNRFLEKYAKKICGYVIDADVDGPSVKFRSLHNLKKYTVLDNTGYFVLGRGGSRSQRIDDHLVDGLQEPGWVLG